MENIHAYRLIRNDQDLPMLVTEKTIEYQNQAEVICPQVIVDVLQDVFNVNKQTEESTFLITLDANRISGVFEMSRGSADRCICDLRGLFTRVLLTTAPVAFVTAHNHPSNTNKTSPSDMDIAIVERIKEAAKVFGLNYFDNIIIGRNDYLSFRNEGLL